MNEPLETAMHSYSVVLTYDADERCWCASVPAFDGATTDGDTPEEALAHARELIERQIAVMLDHGWDVPVEDEPARIERIALARPA